MSKVLLITGGGRGIGHATAIQAATEGWDVCVNYQGNTARAEETVAKIENAGGRAIAVKADISNEEDVVRLFEACDTELGTLQGMVNSAGILGPEGRIEDLDASAIGPLLDINVKGTMMVSREAVKRMSTNSGGSGGAIVLVSSVASRLGGAGSTIPYAASKGAVDSFGWGLAQEVAGEGILVNVVSPGIIDTEIQPAGRVEAMGPKLPFARAGQAFEPAAAILWLLSDDASYVSGANLSVSGAR
ncbi:MAG: SDR family oxidoreductase [Rhodospirillales bacterium]|nr:SDR family oxidoreductase [Rhodospirillales bacterium]